MKTKLLFLIAICLTTGIFAQTFKRQKDLANDCTVIKYYDSDNQIIVEKFVPFDSTQSPYFRLGIFVTRVRAPFDLFMMNSSLLVFDDGTIIKIKDKVDMLFFGRPDQTQLSVNHLLDEKEIELLCTKQISSFKIADISKEYDKSQRADIIKTIQKLKNEKP